MKKPKAPKDKYLILLTIIAITYATYWTYYTNTEYATYQLYFYDIGIATYSAYSHLDGVNSIGIFQYIVYANHIAPFSIFLFPIFALYSFPITLLAIQAIVLSMTGVLIYVVTKDLIESKKISFALAIAFFLNPGLGGMLVASLHPEAFMVPLYIMAFYFYMKDKKVYFLASYALLLSTIEEAPIIGASLLLGLLAYELLYNSKKSGAQNALYNRKKMLLLQGFAMTTTALFAYILVGNYLIASYPSVPYSILSPLLYYGDFLSSFSISNLTTTSAYVSNSSYYVLDLVALSIVFLGLGPASFRNPLISIIFCLPWLVALFAFQYIGLLSYYSQYYSFVLGGSIVSAIMGFIIIKKHKARLALLGKIDLKKSEEKITYFIISLSLMLCVALFSPLYASFFANGTAQIQNYSQINYGLSLIPPNATVSSVDSILPHMYYIKNIEFLQNTYLVYSPFAEKGIKTYWVSPQYIVLYNSETGYHDIPGINSSDVAAYVNSSYTLYYNESGLMIFKKV